MSGKIEACCPLVGSHGVFQFIADPILPASLISLGPFASAFVLKSARPARLHAGAAMVGGVLTLLTGLAHLPSSAHHLLWHFDLPTEMLQSHVHQ